MTKRSSPAKTGPQHLVLLSIDLLDSSLHYPGDHPPFESFHFDVHITSKADDEKSQVLVVVTIGVHHETIASQLGSLTINCTFTMSNFADVVRLNAAGQPDMPDDLVETLHSTALSTARGVMFATFRGTFLHHALLPLITPGSLTEDKKINS
ncbi:hypothetical protein SAMN04488128_106100 [Chitinophaga eiseniae]|uniref:Preprotein translocase subunit SecB n=1 Tax=Chitinophaga eiseniae TaxID=634771 RepID=A0A1T4TRL4_9BACT|nr:hypothetical protein [Chitinophaga eiseniae]SKA43080.1 hypothetical protein SAMN04488128_106100 [Chitinophaga eiseniae]